MATPERVSIRDLAKIAGVSRTTVSLALRDSNEISEATRERIKELAREYDYRSHPAVNALMQQVRRKHRVHDEEVIAFVRSGQTPEEQATGPLEILEGVNAEAHRLGYRVEVFWAGPGGVRSEKLARVLYHRGIRGVIWGPMPYPHPPLVFPWNQFSCIACTPSTDVANLPMVCIDHAKGMALTLEELHRRGAKRIGFVQLRKDDARQDFGWLTGTDLFRHRGGGAKVAVLMLDDELAERSLRAWLERERVDALISTYELYRKAEFLGSSLARASLHVPTGELGKIGGLYQGMARIGESAVRSLSMRLSNGILDLPDHPSAMTTQASFVDGKSLDPLRMKKTGC